MTYSVLAIAPTVANLPALSTAGELARIGDLPGVMLTQLTGPVTKQRIIDRLGRGRYDAVLWTGHGAPGHLLVEGDTIDPRWLAVQLRQAGIKLAVLAACQSGERPALGEFVASFVDVLPPAGVSAIVMLIVVEDRAAIEYDVALFQALAAGATVRAAHETGVEAIAHFGGMVQAPMLIPADKPNGDFAKLQATVPAIGAALASNDTTQAHALIVEAMTALGHIDARITGIETTVTKHETRILAIETHIHPPWQVTFWRVMAAVVFLFAGSLFWIKETREVLFGVVLWAGLAVEGALVLLVVACLLLANAKLERAK